MEEFTLVLENEEITATPGSAAKLIRELRKYTRKKFFAVSFALKVSRLVLCLNP